MKKHTEDRTLWLNESVCICRDAVLVLKQNDSTTIFDEQHLETVPVEKYNVAPWGIDNDLPQRVMGKIDKAEIVGTNANFNWKVMYGQGPRLVRVVRDAATNTKSFVEVTDGEAYEWFTKNNVPFLLMEIMTDISYFGNAFPVLICETKKDRPKFIKGIRHREAMFSRWGVDDNKQIKQHLYCGKWDENPSEADIEASYVIDEFNAVADIKKRLALGKDKRLCFPIYVPSPGRPYYSYPTWWSIFRSGWYDNIVSIPHLKKAILKFNLGVKHIIYIDEEYFKEKEIQLKIAKEDIERRKQLKDDIVKEIEDILAGEENAGRSITSLKKTIPSGNGANIMKYIEIETVKNDITGGEYITDYETGANIVSYAMEVHPSLIGATPGKNSNSLSGSNIREIFIMKQSLSKPLAYLALQWWPAVREVNGWDRNLEIVIQDSLFTTLDNAKSGEIKTANNLTQ